MKNVLFRKISLFLVTTALVSLLFPTLNIAQINEISDGLDFYDREGNLLPRNSDVQTEMQPLQFQNQGQWEWEGFFAGETSWSAKTIISTQDGILYVGTWPDAVIFKSTDNGETWIKEISFADLGQSHILTLFQAQNGDIYAGTLTIGSENDAGIYKLPYGETEWIALPTRPEGVDGDSVLFNTMVRDITENDDGTLFIALRTIRLYPDGSWWPKGEVWKSIDGGLTWLTTGPIGGFSTQYIRSVLSYGDNIYASTGSSGEGEVYKSTNGGDTWENIGGRLVSASQVWTLTSDENGTIYAGASYLYRLANEGENGELWERFTTPDNFDIRVLKIGNDGLLYAGTIKGNIFRTADQGVTWEFMGNLEIEDSERLNVFDLAENNNYLFAATATKFPGSNNYHGIIFRGRDAITGITNEQSSVSSLQYSIYPNPLPEGNLARLNITLPLGNTAHNLRIYNLLGQLIKDVNISQITPGANTDMIIWDGRNTYGQRISSGIYYLTLTFTNANGQIRQIKSKLTYIK
ncbi:T9SS type A sorting domain-containing protein [Patescibacteria group bacterium]|nr:T9SS type A sorting domain-containing protein [Patescibacteria group bacterium]